MDNIITYLMKQILNINQFEVLLSIATLVVGAFLKWIFDIINIDFKLRNEYRFSQGKKIKESLSRTKTPLINACDEMSKRLWNFSTNITQNWHNIDESLWCDKEKYYLRSFVYRFLTMMYWIQEAEDAVYQLDFSVADKRDNSYLKYLKTMKHFFCDRELLNDLNYPAGSVGKHFYKDEIFKYVEFIKKDGKPIRFQEFEEKFRKDYSDIREVVLYFKNIEQSKDNCNYNIIQGFHLFLICFLNDFGLEYHATSRNEFRKLINSNYCKWLTIHNQLWIYLKRHKIQKEVKWVIKDLKLLNDNEKKNKRERNRGIYDEFFI